MRKVSVILVVFFVMFSSSAWAGPAKYQFGDKGKSVEDIQWKLKSLGFFADRTTGIFDKKTELSIREFQKNKGLPVTGKIDDITYDVLMKPNGSLSGKGKNVVETAQRYVGVPYRFGGTSPKGFDCSGFVQYVYSLHGRSLPRMADEQYRVGKAIGIKDLQPGDLVFFSTYTAGVSHSGIYLGSGNFISATSSKGVMVTPLNQEYWKTRYIGAKRIG